MSTAASDLDALVVDGIGSAEFESAVAVLADRYRFVDDADGLAALTAERLHGAAAPPDHDARAPAVSSATVPELNEFAAAVLDPGRRIVVRRTPRRR